MLSGRVVWPPLSVRPGEALSQCNDDVTKQGTGIEVDTSNGSHRPPPYFEWWYFHFVTQEGLTINVVVHETDIFGLDRAPYLSLSLQFLGQKARYFRRPLAEAVIGAKQPYLRVGNRLIEETAGTVRLELDFTESDPTRSLRFSGEITKLAPPLAIQNGILYVDPATDRSSHWVVQVPHATFEGVLDLDGTVQRLKGTAYQDHQWGNILLQEYVSDWVWGHFSSKEAAIIFFQILTQHGGQIDRAAMTSEEGVFAGARMETAHLERLFQDVAPEKFAGSADVSFLNGLLGISFELSPENLMRSRLNEAHDQVLASYLRWSARGEWRAGRIQGPAYGITEYIRIRPATNGGVSCGQHR